MLDKKTFGLGLVACLCLASLAMGQKIVHLKDGTACEAKTVSRGKKLLLRTAFGERTVSKKQVEKTSSAKPVSEEYAKISAVVPANRVKEHQAIAEWCLKNGYLTGLRTELNLILAENLEDEWARATIKKQAGLYVAHESENGTRPRDKRKLYDHLLKKLAARDLVGAVLARQKMSKIPEDIILRPAIKAMKARKPGTRWLAAQLLRDFRRQPDRIVPLYRRCLCDTSEMVRREAVKSLEITKDPVFVKLFSANLRNPSGFVRRNAAEALGEFRMKQAVKPLIAALADGGGATRNHIVRRRHTAYVKDFDVEIAQAAVIADPIVDVATDGVVLDVGLVGISAQRRAMASALSAITGANFGTNAKAWREWWAKQQKTEGKSQK